MTLASVTAGVPSGPSASISSRVPEPRREVMQRGSRRPHRRIYDGPVDSRDLDRARRLRLYQEEASACTRCRAQGHLFVDPAQGSARPILARSPTGALGVLIVGEAPNYGDTFDRAKGHRPRHQAPAVSAACGASTSIQPGHSEAAQRGCRRTPTVGGLYDQRRDGRGRARMTREPGGNAGRGIRSWAASPRQRDPRLTPCHSVLRPMPCSAAASSTTAPCSGCSTPCVTAIAYARSATWPGPIACRESVRRLLWSNGESRVENRAIKFSDYGVAFGDPPGRMRRHSVAIACDTLIDERLETCQLFRS